MVTSMISLLLLLFVTRVHTFYIEDNKCGIEASPNLIHHNPWLVFLEYYRESQRSEIRCAGTLVKPRFVITAAHCVTRLKFTRLVARLGEYDLTNKIDCVSGVCADPIVRIDVNDVTVHPDYDNWQHDIALLRLETEAPYTDFIRPICLPSGRLPQNAHFVASGWGEVPHQGIYSPIKKIIVLPYWRKDRCRSAYKTYDVPDNVICAGGEEGIDTCRGDSGGPLTLIRDRTELWGVTSAGNSHCGSANSPGMYTDVGLYLEWVEAVIDWKSDD